MTTTPASAPAFSFAAIDHVQLAIPPGGEQQVRAFWGELLGLAELPKPPALAPAAAAGSKALRSSSILASNRISTLPERLTPASTSVAYARSQSA